MEGIEVSRDRNALSAAIDRRNSEYQYFYYPGNILRLFLHQIRLTMRSRNTNP